LGTPERVGIAFLGHQVAAIYITDELKINEEKGNINS
jgi:hypothetical protein